MQKEPSPAPKHEGNLLEHSILCVHVNLGWSKLNEYYTLTDRSLAYVASLVLHSSYI